MADADVIQWAREEMGLPPEAVVTVREKDSNDPRCAPIVTELRIESPGEEPYSFHIERRLDEIERMDVVATIAFGGH